MQLFTVHRLADDDETGEERPVLLGRLLLDDGNRLSVQGDEDEADEDMLDAMEECNEAEALIMKVVPAAGAPPRSVAKDRVARDDPRFAEALADNFFRLHGLVLAPDEGKGEAGWSG